MKSCNRTNTSGGGDSWAADRPTDLRRSADERAASERRTVICHEFGGAEQNKSVRIGERARALVPRLKTSESYHIYLFFYIEW